MADQVAGSVIARFIGDNSNLMQSIRESNRGIAENVAATRSAGSEYEKAGREGEGAFAVIGLAAGAAAVEVVRAATQINSALEQSATRMSFLMGGNMEAVTARMEQMSGLSKGTAFPVEQLNQANEMLQRMAPSLSSDINFMKQLQNVSAGTGTPINDLTNQLAFLHQRLAAGDTQLGYSVRSLERMGIVTASTVQQVELMQKQGASTSQLWAALTADFSKFNGAADTVGKTAAGIRVQLKSVFDEKAGEALKPLTDAFKKAGENILVFMQSAKFAEWLSVVKRDIEPVANAIVRMTEHLVALGNTSSFDRISGSLGTFSHSISAVLPLVEALSAALFLHGAEEIPFIGRFVPDLGKAQLGIVALMFSTKESRAALMDIAKSFLQLAQSISTSAAPVLQQIGVIIEAIVPPVVRVIAVIAELLGWFARNQIVATLLAGVLMGALAAGALVRVVEGYEKLINKAQGVVAIFERMSAAANKLSGGRIGTPAVATAETTAGTEAMTAQSVAIEANTLAWSNLARAMQQVILEMATMAGDDQAVIAILTEQTAAAEATALAMQQVALSEGEVGIASVGAAASASALTGILGGLGAAASAVAGALLPIAAGVAAGFTIAGMQKAGGKQAAMKVEEKDAFAQSDTYAQRAAKYNDELEHYNRVLAKIAGANEWDVISGHVIKWQKESLALQDGLGKQGAALDVYRGNVREMAGTYGLSTDAVQRFAIKNKIDLGGSLDDVSKAFKQAMVDANGLGKAFDANGQEIQSFGQILKQGVDLLFTTAKAEIAYRDSVDTVRTSVEALNKLQRENVGQEVIAAEHGVESAMLGVQSAALGVLSAEKTLHETVGTVSTRLATQGEASARVTAALAAQAVAQQALNVASGRGESQAQILDAENRLAVATSNVTVARQALNGAMSDGVEGTRAMVNATLALVDAQNSQVDANLAVTRAQAALAQAQESGMSPQQIAEKAAALADAKARAQHAGLGVLDAKANIADVPRQVAQAQLGLQQANLAVKTSNDSLLSSHAALVDAEVKAANHAADLEAAQRKVSTAIIDSTEKAALWAEQIGNRGPIDTQIQALKDLAKQLGPGSALALGLDATIAKLSDLGTKASLTQQYTSLVGTYMGQTAEAQKLGADITKAISASGGAPDNKIAAMMQKFDMLLAQITAENAQINALAAKAGLSGIGTVESLGLPAYGDGGIVDHRTLAWVGDKGREMILPLYDQRATMDLLMSSGLITALPQSLSGPISSRARGGDGAASPTGMISVTENNFNGPWYVVDYRDVLAQAESRARLSNMNNMTAATTKSGILGGGVG